MKKAIPIICILFSITGGFSDVSAQISVTMPDTSLEAGLSALIPIYVDEITESHLAVFAFQFTIKFDQNVLNISSVENSGTISSPWAGSTVINPRGNGEIDVGAFGVFNNIVGKGVLIYLVVDIIGEHADSSFLELEQFLFNAGNPAVITENGKVRIFSPLVTISFMSNITPPVNVTIDGQEKSIPFDTTWHSGTEHSIGVDTPQYLIEESRALFDSWSDTGDTVHVVIPVTDTVFQCNMLLEHLVALNSDYGSVQGAGWYRQGDTITISIDSLITSGDTTRFVFSGWKGSGQGSYSGENHTTKIIVNEPIVENAQWITQHFVDLESPFGNPAGEGWYNEGDTVDIKIDSLEYLNDYTRFQFNSWEGTGDGSYSGTSLVADIFVNSPIVETAIWDKQFYLSVLATPENIRTFNETGWYFENEPVIEITAPDTVEKTEIKYRFVNWMIDEETSDQNPISVQMDTAHILNAVYQIDSVLIEIATNTEDGFSIYVDSLNYPSPYSKFWEYESEHIVGIDSVNMLLDSLSRYVFEKWDDDGDLFHSVFADSVIKLTAHLILQYYLSVETKPHGLMEFEELGWYVEGDSIQLTEVPEHIFTNVDSFLFNSWIVDSLPVEGNPITIKMNTFHHAIANYENLYFISGTITNTRGLPLDGVILLLSGASEDSVVSTARGQYFFSGIAEGDYQVFPSREHYEFTPRFKQYSPLDSSQMDQNFLARDILHPQVSLLYPTGGQWLKKSTIDTIKWIADDNVGIDSIAVELTVDGGVNWRKIAEFDSGNVNQFIWMIPDTVSKECLIKVHVFDFDGNNGWDVSDSMFTIGSVTDVANFLSASKIPTEFRVQQNYPNPFNNSTVIPFQLPKSSYVTINIYNINGQKVQTITAKNYKAGYHRVNWNGNDQSGEKVCSGVYLYRVEALEKVVIKKFLYVR